MHIADDVERAVLLLAIVPQRLPLNHRCLDFFHVQHVNVPESFFLQTAKRTPQILPLVLDDPWLQLCDRSSACCGPGKFFPAPGTQSPPAARDIGEPAPAALSRFGLHVGRIDHRQPSSRQPLSRDEVQNLESVFAGRLIGLIVGNQAPAVIGRNNLRAQEMLPRKRRLAASGRPHQAAPATIQEF